MPGLDGSALITSLARVRIDPAMRRERLAGGPIREGRHRWIPCQGFGTSRRAAAGVPRLIQRFGGSDSNGPDLPSRLSQYEGSDTNQSRNRFVLDRVRIEPSRISQPLGSKTHPRVET